MNCSFQGLLTLGQVHTCDLCIHEGQERHPEVTGGDTVKVTSSSCCPWVLSPQAASSKALDSPHPSNTTSSRRPHAGGCPHNPSPRPSQDTSRLPFSCWHKRQKGYNSSNWLSSLSTSCSGSCGGFSTRAAFSNKGLSSSVPSQPGDYRAARTIQHTGFTLGSLGTISTILGTRAWEATLVFSAAWCVICAAAAVLHGCSGSLGIHHRHHRPLQVLGKTEVPAPSLTLFSTTHHMR